MIEAVLGVVVGAILGMTLTCIVVAGDESRNVTYVKPEQAIEATLEPGMCHDVWDVELTGRLRFQCSECGGVSLEITPCFCPCCARKVVAKP